MKRLHAKLRANVAINVTAICNDTCNVAEVGTISTFGTLQETLPATPAKPITRSNSVVACSVACNVSSCDSAFRVVSQPFCVDQLNPAGFNVPNFLKTKTPALFLRGKLGI